MSSTCVHYEGPIFVTYKLHINRHYWFYFPYEWFDSLEMLKHDKLPPYEAFCSSLKK